MVLDKTNGKVIPGPTPFESGDVSGKIYRFVVWRNDPTCPENRVGLSRSQDLKQVIVAAAVDDAAVSFDRDLPGGAHGNLRSGRDPWPGQPGGDETGPGRRPDVRREPRLPRPGAGTRRSGSLRGAATRPFRRSSGSPRRPATPRAGSRSRSLRDDGHPVAQHPGNSNAPAPATSGLHARRAGPDVHPGADAGRGYPADQPHYDYATDVEPTADPDLDKGLNIRPRSGAIRTTDACSVRSSTSLRRAQFLELPTTEPSREQKVHKWLSPPTRTVPNRRRASTLTNRPSPATLSLWTRDRQRRRPTGGRICVWLFVRTTVP